MYQALEGLEPARVFYHFGKLSEIPRGSKNEKAVSDHIAGYCRSLGLEVYQDPAWNLVIKKPATKGYQDAPTVILQAHLDMVCEKNLDKEHDFLRDPIPVMRNRDRIYADGTTLGADNGTGVALALAVLEAENLPHPALEAVFTADEEAGMSGIKSLDFSQITGKVVVNLDCSDQGIVVGCAGTIQVALTLDRNPSPLAPGEAVAVLRIGGLQGGHSGLDVGKERGNANLIMARVLADMPGDWGIRVAEMDGGMQVNAITRENTCVIAYPKDKKEALAELVSRWDALQRKELRTADPDVFVVLEEPSSPVTRAGSPEFTQSLISALLLTPCGVLTRSVEVEGLVETSGNIGTVHTQGDKTVIRMLCRSGLDSKKRLVLEKTRRVARLVGAELAIESDSPEWEYRTDSRLRSLIERTYKKRYGKDIVVEVSHGGNECGTFFRKIPGADIVCTGTWIDGAHTPRESVKVSVIQQEWEMLCLTLAGMLDY